MNLNSCPNAAYETKTNTRTLKFYIKSISKKHNFPHIWVVVSSLGGFLINNTGVLMNS